MKLLFDKEFIRNVGVAGHIDHGKTTLTDHILAEAGIISRDLAGKARYLDYWLEEQRRGITMKTTVMSFEVTYDKKRYLIHLCDTPGHVDFSGKVSRAFRLVDSAIFVVDAVEGIMAQTESYLRLALEEVVRPVLCINKIDRLITELRLNEEQIFSRLSMIIKRFNDLISRYAPPKLRASWQVNPKEDTVIFCSALHGWGFTYSIAHKKGIKFGDIIRCYNRDPYGLIEEIPLGLALIEVLTKTCPPPSVAQRLRVKYLWEGSPTDELMDCSNTGPTVFYVSKAVPEKGRIFVTGRVFSGSVKSGDYIRLNDGTIRKLYGVFILHASKAKSIDIVPAGNIFGCFIDARPGDTFSDRELEGKFRGPRYFAYPVLAVAIEPKEFSMYRKLKEILNDIVIEDPNARVEVSSGTGQILLYGIGELHLELLVKKINEQVPIYYTEPLVAFKELITNSVEASSNGLYIEIQPIYEDRSGLIEHCKNIIELIGLPKDKERVVETIINETIKSGPRIGEPIIGMRIKIEAIRKVREEEIFSLLSKCLSSLTTGIIQPYYKFSISVNCEFLGKIISELSSRAAIIEHLIKDDVCEIMGLISVYKSLGIASRLRDLSQGKISVQLEFAGYKLVSRSEEDEILRYIVSRFSKYSTPQ